MQHARYNDAVALGAAAIVLMATFAVVTATPLMAPAPGKISTVSYLNLSIDMNPVTGTPQYSPANFTVPVGTVIVTIVDNDVPMNWTSCNCGVTGTVGGTETLNGTPFSSMNPANVAHTFTIPSLGINVLSPGDSTITFELYLDQTGAFGWVCLAPCGSDGYTGEPMGVLGFMAGTMTVV